MSLCISSICTVPPNHQESRDRKSHGANIDNLGWAFTDMVPQAFAFIKEKPTPHPNETKGDVHPLMKNRTLQLAPRKISALCCMKKEYHEGRPSFQECRYKLKLLFVVDKVR